MVLAMVLAMVLVRLVSYCTLSALVEDLQSNNIFGKSSFKIILLVQCNQRSCITVSIVELFTVQFPEFPDYFLFIHNTIIRVFTAFSPRFSHRVFTAFPPNSTPSTSSIHLVQRKANDCILCSNCSSRQTYGAFSSVTSTWGSSSMLLPSSEEAVSSCC